MSRAMKYGGPSMPTRQSMDEVVKRSEQALFDHLKTGIEALNVFVKTSVERMEEQAADLRRTATALEQRLSTPSPGSPCALCGERPVWATENVGLIECSTTNCMPAVTEEEWNALYKMRDHVKFVRRYEVAKEGTSWSRVNIKAKRKLAQQCLVMVNGEVEK